MKYIILIFIFMFSMSANAQDIKKDGKLYQVKNERVFLDGKDVTDTLNLKEKTVIFKKASVATEKIKLKENVLKGAEKIEKDKKI